MDEREKWFYLAGAAKVAQEQGMTWTNVEHILSEITDHVGEKDYADVVADAVKAEYWISGHCDEWDDDVEDEPRFKAWLGLMRAVTGHFDDERSSDDRHQTEDE